MKLLTNFKPKLFAAMLGGCAAVAGVASWLTGLNFWMLVGFLVVGVLINGLIATVEDGDSKGKPE
jgi:membrane protein implicated in regulation of membrane protease activity